MITFISIGFSSNPFVSVSSGPTRPLGKAELLVEASFADLRHGGDGNLSRAHAIAKKVRLMKKVLEDNFSEHLTIWIF